MLYFVEIEWRIGYWTRINYTYTSRDDAEWAIAQWRTRHGSNGKDTGFRVVETLPSG